MKKYFIKEIGRALIRIVLNLDKKAFVGLLALFIIITLIGYACLLYFTIVSGHAITITFKFK